MEQCDITSWFLFCGRTERDREKFKHKICGNFPFPPMISVKTKFRKMARRSNLYRFETKGRHLKISGKISVYTVIIKRVLDQELPFKYKVDGSQTSESGS